MRVALADSTTRLKPDWIVVVLPVVLAFMVFSFKAAIVLVGLLCGLAFMRRAERRFDVKTGPLVLLFGACAIVFSRHQSWHFPTLFVILGVLIVRLITTVDARRLMSSLVDGWGLYLIINVLVRFAGVRSPSVAHQRLDRMAESSGFIRTVFPLTNSINSPSIIAVAYLVSSICLLRQANWIRWGIWLLGAAAAIYVIFSAGSRAALVLTALLSIGALFFPFIGRWIAQASTVLAVFSSLALPRIIDSLVGVITPVVALAPARNTSEDSISSFQGRDRIWGGVIRYWSEQVNDFSDILFGFGTNGQYWSGASSTYTSVVKGITRNPEYSFVHNAFLQQLYDGGFVGLCLLASAVYWASSRLAKHRDEWGRIGLSAVLAITAVLLCNVTEATMAPGVFQESFWLLFFLIGIACQMPTERTAKPDGYEPSKVLNARVGPGSTRHKRISHET